MTVSYRSLRTKLLIGASISSMLLAGVAEAQDRSGGGRVFGGRGGGDPTAAAARAAQEQATRSNETNSATRRAIDSFRRAAETRQAMNDAQVAARALARATHVTVPNGMGPGGLQVANGVELDPSLWVGANGPVQSQGENGRTNVTIDQTQQQAILSWESFNVGRETDLTFNQGGADWVALNRVIGNSADPSQILGSIKAQGTILILNQNGIIFGGASQVNVRNLVASSANITNAQFLERGIYSSLSAANYVPSFTDAGGAVRVEAGAQITTNTPNSVTSGGGYVLLMGTEVTNEGSIITPRGQATLSAGDNFIVRRGYGTEENQYSTTRGNEVRGLINAGSTSGTVTNAGVIEAAQGDITLAGRTIRQDGVLVSTTSVNQRGTIHLLNSATDGEGSVTLGADSLTTILPELDSEDTALNGQRDALIAESTVANTQRASTTNGGFDDRSLLADRLDQSRIEIVTGGDVVFEGGSQTSAQGGQVAVQANSGRITVEDGARIDVSGVMGVALDMEDNSIKVNIQGNEMRDSPANRDAETIRSQDVWIDVRDLILLPDGTGGYEGDRWYTPGGLLEVGGHLQNMAHGIGEWTAVGGTITLAASEVVAQQGAVFDISGGSLDYRSGYVRSTRVMGADGRMYDIRNAPAHVQMVAVGNAFIRRHDRWGDMYMEVYSDPLFSRGTSQRWEEGYTVGRDAGRLILSAPTVIFEADVEAEVINGSRQTNGRADGVTDGYKLGQHTVAQAGSLALGRYTSRGFEGVFDTDVRISEVEAVSSELTTGGELSEDRLNTAWFDAEHINAQGLGGLILQTRGEISIYAPLQLADGGRLDLVAPVIDIAADITARGGDITATNIATYFATSEALLRDRKASITLREGANLDLRGHWSNLLRDPDDGSKLGFIDGGNVHFASTHDVTIEAGSSIDVSSGGAILTDGSLRGGRGGDVALLANQYRQNVPNPNGILTLDGDIKAAGMSGGGTLSLDSGALVVIGGEVLETDGVLAEGEAAPVDLVLAEDVLVRIGEIMPIDFSVQRSTLDAGETLKVPIQFTNTGHTLNIVVGPGGWDLTGTNMDVYINGLSNTASRYRGHTGANRIVPEGAVITRINGGQLPVGYTLSAQAVPNGLPIPNYTLNYPAGVAVTEDVTVTRGTVLKAGTVADRQLAVAVTQLAADDFRMGFSDYRINGHLGMLISEDTRIDVEMPVYRARAGANEVATGASPTDALELWTPPTYLENPLAGTLTQRGGASLELRSTRLINQIERGGDISISKGAIVSVDPRQAIAIAGGFGSQITVDGTLNAWGGSITIDTARVPTQSNALVSPASIWIGESALLDVGGRAALAVDREGRRYGQVDRGGTIRLGGALDWEADGEADAAYNFIVIRSGARLDASGARAILDIPVTGGARATEVASNGGNIILSSSNGLFLDGEITAKAGGAGAAGGTLAIALETPNYGTAGQSVANELRAQREFLISQSRQESLLDSELESGAETLTSLYGNGQISVEQIEAGGFDNLSLLVNGVVSFDGDVNLTLGQSLRLYGGSYALSEGADDASRVSLSAPHVLLASSTRLQEDNHIMPTVVGGITDRDSSATFTVSGNLIDVRDRVWFGVNGSLARVGGTPVLIDRRGFDLVSVESAGDIRLLEGVRTGDGLPGNRHSTALQSRDDIILAAQRLYPATGAGAIIAAGVRPQSELDPDSVLEIRAVDAAASAPPLSLFGALRLSAGTVRQGGTVYAPLGLIEIGAFGGNFQSPSFGSVELQPGSLTSVSAAGLAIPYGGTIDGIDYHFDGEEISQIQVGGIDQRGILYGIQFFAESIDAAEGSVLDLSGGGDLFGAGFVSGRGGSVNALQHPLAALNPAFGFSDLGNSVYAIVPDFGADYAPVATSESAGNPAIGQRITINEGVPGLPAGTYTLLPADYAMLPGAFRIEIGGTAARNHNVASLSPGSVAATGYLGIADTKIRDSLPTSIILTSGEAVRTHSQFNETSYAEYILADAARRGIPRGMLPMDAKALDLRLAEGAGAGDTPALRFAGTAKFGAEPDSGGFGGSLIVNGSSDIELLAPGASPTDGFTGISGFAGISIHADALNALNPDRILIGGYVAEHFSTPGAMVMRSWTMQSIILRSGAELVAPEVMILSGSQPNQARFGNIVVEDGASINTIGTGRAPWDSSDGFVYQPIINTSAFVVSNGWVNLLAPEAGASTGNISIGECSTGACGSTTRIYSEGTIAASTTNRFSLSDNTVYGTRNLVLGVSAVNLGEDASIAAASAAGQLPAGLTLNQGRLAALLAGNTAADAPAVETLVLNARDAFNMFGSVTLDTIDPATGESMLDRLVLGTPAIHGYGEAGDVASIRTKELIWTGSGDEPGAPVTDRLGSGRLHIQAERILFGFGPNTQPSSITTHDRIALGFANVNLTASERITSSGNGTLGIYQGRGAYTAGEGYDYWGGDLTITSPLVTGEAGSDLRIKAGGDVLVTGSGEHEPVDALGARLELAGRNVTVDTAVALPSGRLALSADQDINLLDSARVDLSGRAVEMYDVTKYSWGGDLVLTSVGGDIRTAAGAVIDLSAEHNRGGTMVVTALGDGAGHVDLAGAILGSASGEYDAGGTVVPYDAAELTVRAQTLADFDGLNALLNEGGVFGARRFQLRQGDLIVGDGVKAREVQIVLDGGDLTINGTIDASGVQVGTIRLAAMGDLTISGTLDAHGTGLRVDSYGKIIDSSNRAIVDLTSREGRLILNDSATIDLRAGTEVALGSGAGQNDGIARGTLDLNAMRLGTNDVAIDVAGTPTIQGAKTVAVNAFRTYDDAPLADLPDVSGSRPQLVTQAYLDAIDVDSQAFINAALGNGALAARLAGLGDHSLRPGVEIVSDAAVNPEGSITVSGDIDLSGYRYGPDANRLDAALRGFGEPGVLSIRPAGDLTIHGSVNDGFAPPPATPDDEAGWTLRAGELPFSGKVVVQTDGIVLDTGTLFPARTTLNFAAPVQAATLPAGSVLPSDAVLTADHALLGGSVVSADIFNADGSLAYAAGSVVPGDVTLTSGMRLSAGMVLRTPASVGAMIWPAGVELPVDLVISEATPLRHGAILPPRTVVVLPDGATQVALRPTSNGVQGRTWAVAPMLGSGATSWDIELTAGADVTSADRLGLRSTGAGSIHFADTHHVIEDELGGVTVWTDQNFFGMQPGSPVPDNLLNACNNYPEACEFLPDGTVKWTPVSPSFSVVRTGTGDLSLASAGDIRMDSLFGVYTAGGQTSVGDTDTQFNRPRGLRREGDLVGPETALYMDALGAYQAWYPDHGGNLTVSAGGVVTGDAFANSSSWGREYISSAALGNWLWRQGTGSAQVDDPIPTAWWVNFGTYALPTDTSFDHGKYQSDRPYLIGFTGFGALGGGNVSMHVGGDVGMISSWPDLSAALPRGDAINLAVGSTGRVLDGNLMLTGGGDMNLRIAGSLNPYALSPSATAGQQRHDLHGAITNLRGRTIVDAGAIGVMDLLYAAGSTSNAAARDPKDVRASDFFQASSARSYNAPILVVGDSAAYLNTRDDLALGGAGDPGRVPVPNTTAFAFDGTNYSGLGQSWFSLWTENTAINLFAAGGNLAPITALDEQTGAQNLQLLKAATEWSNHRPTDGRYIYPSILRAAAPSGSLYYGFRGTPQAVETRSTLSLLLAPSSKGALELLAGNSIYAGGYAITMSGSAAELPNPFDPAFVGFSNATNRAVSNIAPSFNVATGHPGINALFVFGPNSATNPIHSGPTNPARFYAVSGDIVGLRTGELIEFRPGPSSEGLWYEGATPVRILAGRDIVNTGTQVGSPTSLENDAQIGFNVVGGSVSTGNLIVHNDPNDISLVSAGRDIIYANFQVAGPGTLEISAGRNILQEDRGAVTSIGPIVAGDNRPGASIAMMAGMGNGVNWSAIRDLYLDPVNLADTDRPLGEQNGIDADGFVTEARAAPKNYGEELGEWLEGRYGFTGAGEEALAYFDALAPEQQRIFLRQIYYAETREGGREYNDADGPRFGSYLRGRLAVAALFPDKDAEGNTIERPGDITMFSSEYFEGTGANQVRHTRDGAIRTNFGGDIELMAPGGQIVVGVQGLVPGAAAGLVTQGAGDIRLFSEQSILLGLSRILTTFGGDIFGWSEEGDINAGRGAKTTVLYTPPRRTYDNYGNIRLAPQVPSSGAGIGTLNPIPEVAPGDIDLVAPLGTIDAGEAGIRVSGNINLAALQVLNAANIQVQGEARGIPTAVVVNTGALTSASNAATAVAAQAADLAERSRPPVRTEVPTILNVRFLGFGE